MDLRESAAVVVSCGRSLARVFWDVISICDLAMQRKYSKTWLPDRSEQRFGVGLTDRPTNIWKFHNPRPTSSNCLDNLSIVSLSSRSLIYPPFGPHSLLPVSRPPQQPLGESNAERPPQKFSKTRQCRYQHFPLSPGRRPSRQDRLEDRRSLILSCKLRWLKVDELFELGCSGGPRRCARTTAFRFWTEADPLACPYLNLNCDA